jgi:hypothetical protein
VRSGCQLAFLVPASQYILDEGHADMEQIRHFLVCQFVFLTDGDDLASQIFRVGSHAVPSPVLCYIRVKTALVLQLHLAELS